MERVMILPRKLASIRGKKLANFLRGDFKKSLLFVILLMVYLTGIAYQKIVRYKYFPQFITRKSSPRLKAFYAFCINKLDHAEENTIKRISLIELALRNMKYKKTRTLITIGGMAVGIGAIVFLVSLGYGVQQLVVSRVASLEELRQADVSALPGGKYKIDDKALANFKDLQNVQVVLPLITVVGRVNFHNSVSDMAVYGVTSDYLQQSAIKPTRGNIFQSNELAKVISPTQEVAGAETKAGDANFGEKIGSINYSINAGEWIRVRESPSSQATILGYTKKTVVASQGTQVYGAKYSSEGEVGNVVIDSQGNPLGLWIKDTVLLWEEKTCDASQGDCEDGKYVVLRDDNNQQVKKEGYFAEINITSQTDNTQAVLGTSTTSQDTISVDQVSSASATTTTTKNTVKDIKLSKNAKRQAVVNLAMLKILGIKEGQAVGQSFDVSFVATGDTLNNGTSIKSSPAEYKIVGVVPDDRTPVFYVPFVDLRTLGISNYSQVKLVVDNKDNLETVRRQVAALGFTSSSVADTVSQINSLFSTVRTILALLGTIALIVAALGMFNTLTVSLLERTREVGLMKAMGMKSEEVKELFLTESMIMGFFGGILGIILGFMAGKIVGILLSVLAITKGAGFIDVSYIPLSFIIFIISISFIVGLLTGIYPARRATKISALNALRYE